MVYHMTFSPRKKKYFQNETVNQMRIISSAFIGGCILFITAKIDARNWMRYCKLETIRGERLKLDCEWMAPPTLGVLVLY